MLCQWLLRMPTVFPSSEFATGEVRPLHYFGKDLVAYRDEDGALHVLDAHCRHLGAHAERSAAITNTAPGNTFLEWCAA